MPRERHPLHVVVHVPPPRLHQLVRVVPVGQMQEHGGVEVLALAVEVYRAGFVATFQVQSLGDGPNLGDADDAERSPHLALTAVDDRGGRYTGQAYEGSGFGQGRDWQWRGAYRFAPALDRATQTLELMLTELTWTRPAEAQRRYVPVCTVAGPWRFTVPVAPES